MTHSRSRFSAAPAVAGLVFFLFALEPPARAGTSFEFLFSTSHVTDDSQWYLNLAVGNSGYPRTVIEPALPRILHVEADLPVLLFLARESKRPFEFVVGLRADGLSWSVIFGRLGVPYRVLFAGIDRDPGPPYGKAWGHWKKSPKKCRLSDDDIVGLVNVQITRRVTGVPALHVARARGEGRTFVALVAEKKAGPHKASAASGGKRKPDRSAEAPEKGDRAHRDKGGKSGKDK